MIFKTWLSDINKVAIAKDSLSGIRFDSKNASVVTAYTSAIKGLNEEQARYVLTKRYVSEADQADLLVKAQIISATEGVKASELSRQLVLQGLRKEQADALIEQISGNEAITSNTILTKEQTTAILEQAEARKLLSAEQRQNIANDIEESASSAAEATAEMAQASSELAESTAKVGTTSSILARGVSQLGTGMKSLLSIFVSSPIAIIATLTGSIIGLTYIIGKFQDSAKNAAKAASDFASSMTSINSTYNQETQTLNELTEKYQDLREQLIAAKGNEEETYSIKSQMLELQQQLNDIYGDEYDKVNLVTDAYKDQTEELKKNAKQKADNYLNENVDKIEEATKKMTSNYDYVLGNFNYGLQDASIGNDLHDQIKKLAEKNGIEWDDNKGFVFKGTAEEASKAINQFMTDVRGLRESEDGLSDGIIDNLKAFDSSMSNQLDIANKIIDGYQETYETAQLAQISSDNSLSKGYNDAVSAVEKYNDAVSRSENPYDDENVKKAWDNLQTIKNGIKENEAEWGQYSNIMDDVFSTASDDAYSFYQTMQNDDSISKLTDDLQGLSDTDLQSMADDGVEDSFDKLCQKANEYGLEVQDVIDLLLQLGVAQGKVEESAPDKTDILSFSDAWEQLKNSTDDNLKGQADDLLKLAEAGQLTSDALEKLAGGQELMKNTGLSADELAKQINSLADASTQLQSMSSQISKMSDMLADKKNGTVASASDLAGFDAEVRGLDSWEEFERVMGSSKSTMEQCQRAANDLATEYVNSNNFLAQLNDTNKDYYITQLDNMGVDNAEEVIKNALIQKIQVEAAQEEFLAQKKKETGDATYDLTNATAEEIAKFAEEKGYSDAVTQSLITLAVKKELVNGTTIDTSSDISALINLISYLGGATTALQKYQAAKNQYVGMNDSSYNAYIEGQKKEAQKEVDDFFNDVNEKINTPVKISPTGSTSGSSSKNSGSSKSDTKQTIDWIDRLLTNLQKKIDATKAKFENLFTLKSKKNNLTTQIKQTTTLLNATKKSADKYKQYADKVGLSASLKKKVQNGDYNISDYSSDTAEKIQKYQDYYDKYKELKQQADELTTDIRSLKEQRYQLYVDDAEAKIANSQAWTELASGDYTKQNKHLEAQKKYLKQEYDYLIEIAKLNGDSVEVAKLKAELQKELNELTKQEFDNISNTYDQKLEQIQNSSDVLNTKISGIEAKGYVVSETMYKKLANNEKKQLSSLEDELEKLRKKRDEGLKDGTIKKNTDAWYEMQSSIWNVRNAIEEAKNSLVEYENQMRQLKWDAFDRQEDFISQIQDESDFLIDLISGKKLYDDNGNWTDYANATAGLRAVNYNAYMAQTDDYEKEIKSLQEEINNDPYNLDLIQRKQELINTQRDLIKSAESEKEAIKSLVSDGYNKWLDALQESIDKRKEELDAVSDLYDYEKKISELTKNVSTYEKQQLALQGDDSEETKAKLQQINVELQNARDELQETEYEQWKTDQQKMLDKLSDDAEEWISKRLDDTDSLIADVIESTNKNGNTIKTTLEKTTSDVGTSLSSDMKNIWNGANGISSIVTTYGNGFDTKLTTVNETLLSIKDYVADISDNANSDGDYGNTPENDAISFINKNKKEATHKRSEYGVLNQYIYDKTGGYALTKANEKKLADILGVKTSSTNLTGTDLKNILAALKKTGFSTGGTIGKAIRTSGEDGFILARTGEEVLSLEKIKELGKSFQMMNPVINNVKSMIPNSQIVPRQNVGGNTVGDVTMNIQLEGIKDYEQFKSDLMKDKQIEKFVQTVTFGNALGKNSLSKYKI